MTKIDKGLYDLGYLDTLSGKNSPVHRLDPRIKVLIALFFIVTVVSFGKYEISRLLPFFLLPVLAMGLAGLPSAYLFKKLLFISPFVLLIAVFNPLLDRDILMNLGGLPISGGCLSFASIILRFLLTAGAVLILIATTGFTAICLALEKLGAPRVFAVQLLFLYRYLFVLVEESTRMSRARALRSFGGKGMGLAIAGRLLGSLLLRTLARARRIHLAMLCRGFTGEIRLNRQLHIHSSEYLLLAGICGALVLLRLVNIPLLAGRLVLEILP